MNRPPAWVSRQKTDGMMFGPLPPVDLSGTETEALLSRTGDADSGQRTHHSRDANVTPPVAGMREVVEGGDVHHVVVAASSAVAVTAILHEGCAVGKRRPRHRVSPVARIAQSLHPTALALHRAEKFRCYHRGLLFLLPENTDGDDVARTPSCNLDGERGSERGTAGDRVP